MKWDREAVSVLGVWGVFDVLIGVWGMMIQSLVVVVGIHVVAWGGTGSDGPIASPEPGWPQWRGPHRDGISAETRLLTKWPEGGPRLVWKIDGLGRGWSSPIIVGQRLYVTGDLDDELVVFAFDRDGKPVWQAKNGRAWTGAFPGSRACCTYSEGKLYLLGSHGRLACLEATSGKELWVVELRQRFETPEIQWGLSECLLVDGPWVFVTPVGGKALIAALDKQTGRTVWATPPLGDDRPTHASPFLFRHGGKRILANCTSAHGFGVDADTGRLLWSVPLKSPYGVNVAAPVYGSGQVFYVTAYALGACYAVPTSADNSALEKVWDTTLDTCTGTVVLVDGLLYGSGYRKHKSWVCLDWKTGEIRFESKAVTTSAAVYADGRLYCLAEDGRAALVTPLADQFRIDGEFRLITERVRDAWSHPVLLDGRLYLRYHDSLWCYEVGIP